MRRPARKFALILASLLAPLLPATTLHAFSVEGSTVSIVAPGEICGGLRYLFSFHVYNGSPDEEWLDEVEVAFPAGFVIDAATAAVVEGFSGPWAFEFSTGADGNVALWRDADGEYGEIWSGDSGTFSVEVEVPADLLEGPILSWRLSGDGWADPPHDLTGVDGVGLCSTATVAVTWGLVKTLYR